MMATLTTKQNALTVGTGSKMCTCDINILIDALYVNGAWMCPECGEDVSEERSVAEQTAELDHLG